MTEFLDIEIICGFCNGTGQKPQGFDGAITCPHCGGDGRIHTGYLNMTDFIEKLDSIIAEQISQREDLAAFLTQLRGDLTAALTQIWNKVKDL